MNIDADAAAALIDALGVPAAVLLGLVFLFLKYPPRPPAPPEAELLAELRKLTEAVNALQTPQHKLIDEINDLARTVAEMNGRLSR